MRSMSCALARIRSSAVAVVGLALLSACAASDAEDALDEIAQEELAEQQQAIIGGSTPAANSHPWLARITRSGVHHCGGSLIHKSWVLTAGHCVSGVDRATLRVILGDHSVSSSESTEQVRRVAAVHVHPDFGTGFMGVPTSDVALLRLESPASINAYVQTVALPATSSVPSAALMAGWGLTAAGTAPSTLKSVSLSVRSNSVCDAVPLLRTLRPNELCVGTAASGVCSGDSGGPLTYITGGRRTQIGVASWVNGACGTDPQVFARVASFRSWIESTVATPLRGRVRFVSRGALATGTLTMWCANSGEYISAPTHLSGLELSMECDGGSVTASCEVTQWLRWISGFNLKRDASPVHELPFGFRNAEISFNVVPGSTVSVTCTMTSTPPE